LLPRSVLDYHGIIRCVTALVLGVLGATIYQRPLVVRDRVAFVREISGIQVVLPA